jgi:hypothetical protein
LNENFIRFEEASKNQEIKGKSFLPETRYFDIRERFWESTD